MNFTSTIKGEGSKNMGWVSSIIHPKDNNAADYSLRKKEEGTHPIPIPFFLPKMFVDHFEGAFNVILAFYN